MVPHRSTLQTIAAATSLAVLFFSAAAHAQVAANLSANGAYAGINSPSIAANPVTSTGLAPGSSSGGGGIASTLRSNPSLASSMAQLSPAAQQRLAMLYAARTASTTTFGQSAMSASGSTEKKAVALYPSTVGLASSSNSAFSNSTISASSTRPAAAMSFGASRRSLLSSSMNEHSLGTSPFSSGFGSAATMGSATNGLSFSHHALSAKGMTSGSSSTAYSGISASEITSLRKLIKPGMRSAYGQTATSNKGYGHLPEQPGSHLHKFDKVDEEDSLRSRLLGKEQ